MKEIKTINIIGDVAGRFDELQLLLAKMPKADLTLFVGDLMDRGPKSKQVIELIMNSPDMESIYGNHEDLMLEAISGGDMMLWQMNGGVATMISYADENDNVDIPVEHVKWLKSRPIYFETDNLFVSHAPCTSLSRKPPSPDMKDHFFIWNRYEPSKPQEKYMIYGHNGKFKVHKWGDGTDFAMCIDNSHKSQIMGVAWPSKETFSVDYLT